MGSVDVILNEVEHIRNSNESPDYINGDVYVDASSTICSTIMPRVIPNHFDNFLSFLSYALVSSILIFHLLKIPQPVYLRALSSVL